MKGFPAALLNIPDEKFEKTACKLNQKYANLVLYFSRVDSVWFCHFAAFEKGTK